MKNPTSFRLSEMTTRQLAELISATGLTQSEVMATAIDRMYQMEIEIVSTSVADRVNLDDNTAVDWKGPGYYEAFTFAGEDRYVWQQVATTDNPGGETVYVTAWKQLIGKDLTSPKRW